MKTESESVRVIVRCRPLNEKEISENNRSIINVDNIQHSVSISNPKSSQAEPVKQFYFDEVYDWNSEQIELYNTSCKPIVDAVLHGFNGTIFAYGQTGSGKTYTMQGIQNNHKQRGVIHRSFEQIFDHISDSKDEQYLIRASYLEIYNEDIRDLLSKNSKLHLELREKADIGIYVKGLSTFVCKNINEIEHTIAVGNKNRSIGSTNMNEHSSRSHTIFIITVECSSLGVDGKSHIRMGKLNLVDLAGSERQAKTGMTGERLKESTKINLSLTSLGHVISALIDGKSSHIPYRDSKLTRLLQSKFSKYEDNNYLILDSLGGNAKTIMIANIGPASYNYDETLTTLRYASHAKCVQNTPRINEDPKDALLRKFQEEIAKLKAMLAKRIDQQSNEVALSENILTESCLEDQVMQLELEKQNIMKDNIIGKHLKEKENQLFQERRAQEQIKKNILSMESKLLSGKNIMDHAQQQQQTLDKCRLQIAEQKRREKGMLNQLKAEKEAATDMHQTYSSLQQEVEVKSRKLLKLFNKVQAKKQEIIDIGEKFYYEKEKLLNMQHTLIKEIRMRHLIIENFIPAEEQHHLLNNTFCTENENSWAVIPCSAKNQCNKRPVTSVSRRPVTKYALLAAMKEKSPRYKGENILNLSLDMPLKITKNYHEPEISPIIHAVFQDILQDEEQKIIVDASLFNKSQKVYNNNSKIKQKILKSKNVYPQPRGLVPK